MKSKQLSLFTGLILAVLPSLASAAMPPYATRAAVPVTSRGDDTVDALIVKGRALLDAKKFSEAEAAFAEAEKKDGATFKTRLWSLRTALALGHVNDVLNELDKLIGAGQKGLDMDYLYGMAFATKARGYITENVAGATIKMSFLDAVSYLDKVTSADAVKYHDAFLPLAEAAWYVQELGLGRKAAEKALELAPADADAALMLGKIALSQFGTIWNDEALREEKKAEADAHWEAARVAFEKAAASFGEPKDKIAAATAGEIQLQLAQCLAWKKKDEAAKAYGAAMGFAPGAVNFQSVLGVLGGEKFLPAMELGAKNYATKWGAEDNGDATLVWWLGYARFDQKQYAPAEEAFQTVLKKQSDVYNSWFFIALSRYHQQKFEEAIAALRKNFELDPVNLVASISASPGYNLPIVEYLAGWLKGKDRNLDAAYLTEIICAAAPEEARFWNNLGLFYRDAGDQLAQKKGADDKTKAKAQELWEKSLVAYEKALSRSPEDPNYLNDLAVILHYNLHRDLERAKALYEKAYANATKELERKDLSADLREIRKIAAHDSKNNLDKLTREMEKKDVKKDDAKKEGETKKDGPQ
jgi:tetratricopeptide (TPR) repeat protein